MRMWMWGIAVAVVAPVLAQEPTPFLRVVEEDDGRIVALEMGVREFARPDGAGPKLTIAGAVHIAEGDFYTGLQEILDAQAVVLFESVRPSGTGRDIAQTDEARVRQTERRLRFLAGALHAAKGRGEWPESFEALAEELDGALGELVRGSTTDAWGGPIDLRIDAGARDGFDLVSRGADGVEGGEGFDADLAWSGQAPLSRSERGALAGDKGGLQAQLAEALDLTFQLEGMSHDRPNWRNSDLSIDEVQDRLEAAGADGGALFKLLDGSGLSSRLIGILVKLIGITESTRSMTKLMLVEMLGHADALLEAQAGMEGLMKVIIEDRNAVVIEDLRSIIELEPEVETVGIIYGAGHLPDLVARLREMGYEPGDVRWLRAIEVDVTEAGLTVRDSRQMRKMMGEAIQAQLKRAGGR